jgi:hypothetical protein
MQEEQKAKSQTPQVIALLVVVVLVIIGGAWNVMRATGGNNAPPAQAAATTPAATGPAGTATAAGPASPAEVAAGPGEIRDKNPLDDEGPNYIGYGTQRAVFQVPTNKPPVADRDTGIKPTRAVRPPVGAVDTGSAGPPQIGQIAPEFLFHPVQFRVEGVVTGPDGFAEITQNNQTVFKRPGQAFLGYYITRLSMDGVVVKHQGGSAARSGAGPEIAIWPIGENLTVMIPGAAPSGGPSGAAPAPMPVRPMNMGALPAIQVPPHTLPRRANDYMTGKTQFFMPTSRE